MVITIPNSLRGANSRVAFEVVADRGSIIYVDEFGIGDSKPLAIADGISSNQKVIIAPNPATEQTHIMFALDAAAQTSIFINDMLGRNVGTINKGILDAGEHNLSLNEVISHLGKGVYLVQVQAGDKVLVPGRVVVE
jgi:hypothetical protein